MKCLGFVSNTARCKRQTLIHVFQVLRVTTVRSMRFCIFYLYQALIGDQIHIASTGGVKLQPSLQLSSVWKVKARTSGSRENGSKSKKSEKFRVQFGNYVLIFLTVNLNLI